MLHLFGSRSFALYIWRPLGALFSCPPKSTIGEPKRQRAKKHGVLPTPQCRGQAVRPARDVRRPSSGGPASVAGLLPAADPGPVPVPGSASEDGVPGRVPSPCLGAAHAAAARSYCHAGGDARHNGEGYVAGRRHAAFALRAHRTCSPYPSAAAAS